MPEKRRGACRDMVQRLLVARPNERLGNLAGGAAAMKGHPYFAGFAWDEMRVKSMPAPWIPGPERFASGEKDLAHAGELPTYEGDQALFSDW